MRAWYHEVSGAWLEAKRKVLSATEIKSLLPEHKRNKKAKLGKDEVSPGFAALWAEKNSTTKPETEAPSRAAARGHIMEPWAVRSWNDQVATEPSFWHWDDCVIARNGVGFSPDAMNVPQTTDKVGLSVAPHSNLLITKNGFKAAAPSDIMEIKSYETAHHMKCCLKNKMDHDELMQLGTAFYVLPSLERAVLLFFCPGAPRSMHSELYTRDDLKEQIKLVEEIAEEYKRMSKILEDKFNPNDTSVMHALCTEEEVYLDFLKNNDKIANSMFMLK